MVMRAFAYEMAKMTGTAQPARGLACAVATTKTATKTTGKTTGI